MKTPIVKKSNLPRSMALATLLWALAQSFAIAEITDSAANGFTIKLVTTIHAAPTDVYRRLMRIGDWWSSDHTFSGDAHNLFIEERPMGCFCEKLPTGGGVRHMEVILLSPGKTLRMSGGLGPLHAIAATATMTCSFSPVDGGTKFEVTYTAAGYLPQGMNSFAAPVDGVLIQQIARLKNYVEAGHPSASAGLVPAERKILH